jgi:acyl-coenzyme A thioesterase PaaI-like protein
LVGCATDLTDAVTLAAGTVFGGYIGCLVDHFAGLAMMTVMADDVGFLTAGIELRFHRRLVPGRCDIEAAVVRMGSRRAVVEVRFVQHHELTSTAEVEQVIGRRPAVAAAVTR